MPGIYAVLRTALKSVANARAAICGRCVVCGWPTIFLCADPATARNNTFCAICRCVSRKRHVSKILLREVFTGESSIAAIRDTSKKVLCVSARDPYIKFGKPCFSFCDLIPGVEEGTAVSEVCSCQNLEHLTFGSGIYDAVITEDVLEHVRHVDLAFREIHRVLRSGGVHIFTVPFLFDRPTLVRVQPGPEGDVHLMEPEYHGDPLRGGILAYRTFGIDLFEQLSSLGFSTTLEIARYGEDFRHGIVDSFVIISRKAA